MPETDSKFIANNENSERVATYEAAYFQNLKSYRFQKYLMNEEKWNIKLFIPRYTVSTKSLTKWKMNENIARTLVKISRTPKIKKS